MRFKNLLLALCLLFAFSVPTLAQDKYEQGVVTMVGSGDFNAGIHVSLENKPLQFTKLQVKNLLDFTEVFPILKSLQEEGWEVYNTATFERRVIYFVRRKIK